MPASRVDLRNLQAPLKAEYPDNPDAARITLRVKSRPSETGKVLRTPPNSPHIHQRIILRAILVWPKSAPRGQAFRPRSEPASWR